MAFYNRCVNCTITLRNPRIVSRGVLELDTPLRDLLISWISPIEVSSEYRVCEECFVILQIQAQMDEPCRNYGHRSVCLECGVSVLRARSIPMGSNRHECTVIQAWVPQIQADLSIFTRVCRPCWRRANRAQATSTASSQQELDQIMPIFVDFYIAGAIINHFHPFLWDRTNAREIVAKALSKLNVPNYLEHWSAALTCWKGQAEVLSRKFKLEPYCTVFQAELYAILQATECVLGKGWKEAAVLSDSRSSLQSLADPDSSHPITKAIQGNLAQLRDNGQTVSLYWIRAHVGVIGNERADQLAKGAALGLKSKSHYDCCPISFVKRHVRAVTKAKWESRYRSENTAATTKAFFPCGESAFGVVRKIEMDGIAAQIFTGHGGFSAYLHRFKKKDTPRCVCDPNTEEDIFHVLLDCPLYSRERHDAQTALNTPLRKDNLKEIMIESKYREIFIKFSKSIVERVIERNKDD
ncbi:hypothetical protein evm_004809 [Chilo suppressalis]|nr:hypothetical protein evm_004809 [Chilo suppressalis]